MLTDLAQPLRDLRRRQDEIHAAAVDRAVRHAGIPGGFFVLREGDASDRLDLAQAERSVGPGARKNYADRPYLFVFRKRPEQKVDGQMGAATFLTRGDMQDAA